MQTLYLIRHTQPDIAPGICYGQLDIDVSTCFDNEARQVTNWLPSLDFIITSPLLRTRKLADFLAKTKSCKLETDFRLMEKHFGIWEGRAWDEIEPNEIDAWAANVMNYAPSGGESAQQVILRIEDFLSDLKQLPQRKIALVAHGGSIRAILAHQAGIPLTDTLNWRIEYGAVIGIKISESGRRAHII